MYSVDEAENTLNVSTAERGRSYQHRFPVYDKNRNPMVRVKFLSFKKSLVVFYFCYSQIHSDLEW